MKGSFWAEDIVGTNAASMAITLDKPIYLCGYEHFCLFSHVSACFASPIMDNEKLLGGAMHIKSKMDMKKVACVN